MSQKFTKIQNNNSKSAAKGKLLKYQGTDYCEFLPQTQAGGGIVDGRGGCIRLTLKKHDIMTTKKRIIPRGIRNNSYEMA
jgi:hypothetical protein